MIAAKRDRKKKKEKNVVQKLVLCLTITSWSWSGEVKGVMAGAGGFGSSLMSTLTWLKEYLRSGIA